jgi:hypothetical protein
LNSCKGVQQCFCFDRRFACPCDKEVPCVWTLCCFFVCCHNFKCDPKCCVSIDDLVGTDVSLMSQPNSSRPVTAQSM